MADSGGISNFVRVFHGVLELHVVRVDEVNASQHSSNVELRLLLFCVELLSTYFDKNFSP